MFAQKYARGTHSVFYVDVWPEALHALADYATARREASVAPNLEILVTELGQGILTNPRYVLAAHTLMMDLGVEPPKEEEAGEGAKGGGAVEPARCSEWAVSAGGLEAALGVGVDALPPMPWTLSDRIVYLCLMAQEQLTGAGAAGAAGAAGVAGAAGESKTADGAAGEGSAGNAGNAGNAGTNITVECERGDGVGTTGTATCVVAVTVRIGDADDAVEGVIQVGRNAIQFINFTHTECVQALPAPTILQNLRNLSARAPAFVPFVDTVLAHLDLYDKRGDAQ
jgi:hypothetical protein